MDCPFIDTLRPKCSEHLNLQNLNEAMIYCVDNFRQCPIYRNMTKLETQLSATEENHHAEELVLAHS